MMKIHAAKKMRQHENSFNARIFRKIWVRYDAAPNQSDFIVGLEQEVLVSLII